jgi:histidinol-phosphate aminotransferase
MSITIPEHILAIHPYVPGKPIEELEREYGLRGSIKLASNENPLGPSPLAVAALSQAVGNLHRYPDGGGHDLLEAIGAHLGISPGQIVMGNGSDDIIALLTRTLLRPGDEALIPRPSFLMYDIAVRSAGARSVFVPLAGMEIDLEGMRAALTPRTRLVFICNPNNPTGGIVRREAWEHFLAHLPPSAAVVLDEAYIEFARDPACPRGVDYLEEGGRTVITLRTFSKLYGLAGLRVGYGIMPKALAEALNRVRAPFNVNSLGQVAAAAALRDAEFVARTLKTVHEGLDYLYHALGRMGLGCHPTQTNFFLLELGRDAQTVFEKLLRRGVIVRCMRSYGFPQCIRITVGKPEENRRFVDCLKEVLAEG